MDANDTGRRPYTPRPGSVAARALLVLEDHRGREISTAALAEALQVPANSVSAYLVPALEAGLVFARQKGGHVRSPRFWSLDDLSAGAPVPPPGPQEPSAPAEPADEPAQPAQAQAEAGDTAAAAGEDDPELERARALVAPVAPLQPAPGTRRPARPAVLLREVSQPLRFALWSDGRLQISRGADEVLQLGAEDTRALLAYLNRIDLPEAVDPPLEVRHATAG